MTSKTTVAQKCSGLMEIQKYHRRTDQRTDLLTWVGARDTCMSKKKRNWEIIALSPLQINSVVGVFSRLFQENPYFGKLAHSCFLQSYSSSPGLNARNCKSFMFLAKKFLPFFCNFSHEAKSPNQCWMWKLCSRIISGGRIRKIYPLTKSTFSGLAKFLV